MPPPKRPLKSLRFLKGPRLLPWSSEDSPLEYAVPTFSMDLYLPFGNPYPWPWAHHCLSHCKMSPNLLLGPCALWSSTSSRWPVCLSPLGTAFQVRKQLAAWGKPSYPLLVGFPPAVTQYSLIGSPRLSEEQPSVHTVPRDVLFSATVSEMRSSWVPHCCKACRDHIWIWFFQSPRSTVTLMPTVRGAGFPRALAKVAAIWGHPEELVSSPPSHLVYGSVIQKSPVS